MGWVDGSGDVCSAVLGCVVFVSRAGRHNAVSAAVSGDVFCCCVVPNSQ